MTLNRKKKDTGRRARDFLIELAKRGLGTTKTEIGKNKKRVKDKLGIPIGTLDGMLNSGKGSIESWATLIAFLYDISENQLSSLFAELKRTMKRKSKISQGQLAIMEVSDQLSEDKKIFWAKLIEFSEGLKDEFIIKKKRKKGP